MQPTRITSDDLLSVQAELMRREPLFHRPELGTTREVLETMTADDFWETGASGRRYSRDFVIETVTKRYAEGYQDEWRSDDFYCQLITTDHYLLTYTLYQGKRVTRRTTLWRQQGEHWIALYHQGTILDGATDITSG